MSGISTHILDVSLGKPAPAVQVLLHRLGKTEPWSTDPWAALADTRTDPNGRAQLLPVDKVHPGLYRLTFLTGPYFKSLTTPTLYPEITITVNVLPDQPNYHIPLLLSPHGYTTYRGT